jgi:protein involved in polysaccharide export with SLBB domain
MTKNVLKWTVLWSLVCGWGLAGLLVTGCRTGSPTPQFAGLPGSADPRTDPPVSASGVGSTAPAPTTPVVAPGPAIGAPPNYGSDLRIRPGDSLIVTFSDLPPPAILIPVEERVKEDGTILLLQNLTFVALGKTRAELEKEIHDRYVPKYYTTLTVSVRQQKETQFYSVFGEARLPDRKVYISRITVLGAIASAGGFTDFAHKTAVKLTRADGRQFTINCVKAQTNPTLDLEVFPGDQVNVPRRTWPWQR